MAEKKKKKKSEKTLKVDKNKKSDKKQMSGLVKIVIWIAVIVIGVFLLFLLKNLKPETPETPIVLDEIYNGYVFTQMPQFGLWSVMVKTPSGDIPIEFYYHPQQVENYEYNSNITRDVANMILRKGRFLIGFDVNYSDKGIAAVAGSEVSRITGKVFGLETKSGFVDYVGDNVIPVINCSIANYKNMVLEFRVGEESQIVYDNNYCITIYSKTPEDTVKLADFLDYKLLGIIKSKKVIEKNSSVDIDMNVPNITISG